MTSLDTQTGGRRSGDRPETRAKGEARVEVDGALVELPNYLNACRLIAWHRDLTGAI